MGTTLGLIFVEAVVLSDLRRVVKLYLSRTQITTTQFSTETIVKVRMLES